MKVAYSFKFSWVFLALLSTFFLGLPQDAQARCWFGEFGKDCTQNQTQSVQAAPTAPAPRLIPQTVPSGFTQAPQNQDLISKFLDPNDGADARAKACGDRGANQDYSCYQTWEIQVGIHNISIPSDEAKRTTTIFQPSEVCIAYHFSPRFYLNGCNQQSRSIKPTNSTYSDYEIAEQVGGEDRYKKVDTKTVDYESNNYFGSFGTRFHVNHNWFGSGEMGVGRCNITSVKAIEYDGSCMKMQMGLGYMGNGTTGVANIMPFFSWIVAPDDNEKITQYGNLGMASIGFRLGFGFGASQGGYFGEQGQQFQ